MSKKTIIVPRRLFYGIDVSAVSLAVAIQEEDQIIQERDFPNGVYSNSVATRTEPPNNLRLNNSPND